MDEEGDVDRAAHWDLEAADAAYKAQVSAYISHVPPMHLLVSKANTGSAYTCAQQLLARSLQHSQLLAVGVVSNAGELEHGCLEACVA